MKNFFSIIALLLGIVGIAYYLNAKEEKREETNKPAYALAIHGGAGAMSRDLMTPEMEKAYRAGLDAALAKGESILDAGGSAMDAVEATIHLLEDNPLFNAGKGAVFTHEETVELDASFMDGKSGNAGAVAGIKSIRHPISAARLVMDSSVHVMMAGQGADNFAAGYGLEVVENSYFHTEKRLKQVQAKKAGDEAKAKQLKKYGTVGCVALDKQGNLAAGTSTGGMTNKRYGRVGDAPIIGAGTYANNKTCAVSCTGHGEYFIRNVVAYDVSALMEYGGKTLQQAGDYIIHDKLVKQDASGGLISLDKNGNIHMPFNSAGMFRGFIKSDGSTGVAIYDDQF
ncbi:MAG: isoaspartyl peptidase/L-asparaginase [Bacteroidota bacterium]